MPLDRVWYVDADDNACSNAGPGSSEMPLCDLLTGLGKIGASEKGTIILRDTPGNTYEETLLVSSGRTVAIVGKGAMERPVWSDGSEDYALAVQNNAIVYLSGVRIEAAVSRGVEVAQAQVWIQRSEIVNNAGGGILVNGGALTVENSFVGGSSSQPALNVQSGTSQVNYSTLALGPVVPSAALFCVDGTDTSVRNSIIVSTHATPEVNCPNVTISSSALEMTMGDNVALGDVEINWFSDYLQGEFLLVAGVYPPAIETAASWATGDPTTDIEGDTRPALDGTPDFAGADRIP
ncbi:hypothetical protein [Enhygromyxa salina]|nr:hypothetical protein [Enhygromyxa salina]